MGKSLFQCILFLQNMILNMANMTHYWFDMKIDKLSIVFKESYCLWVISPRIWNVLCFLPILVEISTVVLEKQIKNFIFSMYFLFFVIISPWKMVWPFIWTNLNPLYQTVCFVPSLIEISPVILEKIFKDLIKVISLFPHYLRPWKGRGTSFE